LFRLIRTAFFLIKVMLQEASAPRQSLIEVSDTLHNFQDPPPPAFNPEYEEEIKKFEVERAVPLFTGPEADFSIGVQWSFKDEPIDIDAQAVFYDGAGQIVDACYYNQKLIFNGAVKHSGDETSGAKEGDDESIMVDLNKVPHNANIISVLITCFSGMDFRGVTEANATVRNRDRILHNMKFGLNSECTAFAICVLFRARDGVWYFQDTTKSPHAFGQGRNFQEATTLLAWMLNLVSPSHLRGVHCLSFNKTFEMKKGDRAGLPGNALTLKLGLGWEAQKGVDLDASCISLNKDGRIVGTVYYQDLKDPGIIHSGDNLTGEGKGDDEIITVQLHKLSKEVCQLVFLVTIYSESRTFGDVYDAYIRIMAGPEMKELAYFPLSPDEGGKVRGSCLIFSRLYQTTYGWQFEALGEEAHARTPKTPAAKKAVRDLEPPAGISDTWRPTNEALDQDAAVKWHLVKIPPSRITAGTGASGEETCCLLL